MISAVILTWNSEKYISKCLTSLFKELDNSGLEAEVFVVDGASVDSTIDQLKLLQEQYQSLKIIQLDKNKGTTVSRNLAIKRSRGEYILVLDSDTEVLPGVLKTLIETIEKDNDIGVAAPQLRYPDNAIQPSCKRFPTILMKLFKFLPFNALVAMAEKDELYEPVVYEAMKVTEVDYCISAAWLIKREAIEDVGLLDENIFYSPEDVDFCLRMWLRGWKIVYNPNATIVHHTQRVSHKNLSFALSHAEGLFYYFKKHGYWFSRKKLYRRLLKVARTKSRV